MQDADRALMPPPPLPTGSRALQQGKKVNLLDEYAKKKKKAQEERRRRGENS